MSQVLQFTGTRVARMPDNKPDLSGGFCQIPKAIFSAMICHSMTPTQARVLKIACQLTFGWNKESDWMAGSVMAKESEGTLSANTCSSTLNELIELNIIIREGGGRSRSRVNMNVDEWIEKKKATKGLIAERNRTRNEADQITGNSGESPEPNNLYPVTTNSSDSITTNSGDTLYTIQTDNTSSSETGSRQDEDPNLKSSVEAQPEDPEPPKKIPNPPAPVDKPNAAIKTPNGKQWGELVDLKLAEGMARAIDRLLGSAAPANRNLVSWANTIRLMREQDERDPREIRDVFIWANNDEFWSSNILSPSKLRTKWGDLFLKRKQELSNEKAGSGSGAGGNEKLTRQLTDVQYARKNFY